MNENTLEQNTSIYPNPFSIDFNVNVNGFLENWGFLNVNINATLANNGSLTNNATLENTGSLTNTGTLYNRSNLTNYGTLANNGSLTNESNLTNAGALANNGILYNNSNVTITLSGTLENYNEIQSTGGTWKNYGALTSLFGQMYSFSGTNTLFNYETGVVNGVGNIQIDSYIGASGGVIKPDNSIFPFYVNAVLDLYSNINLGDKFARRLECGNNQLYLACH